MADLLHGLLDVLGVVGGDVGVQRLVLPGQRLPVLAPDLAVLHRPLASDDDLGPGLRKTIIHFSKFCYRNNKAEEGSFKSFKSVSHHTRCSS